MKRSKILTLNYILNHFLKIKPRTRFGRGMGPAFPNLIAAQGGTVSGRQPVGGIGYGLWGAVILIAVMAAIPVFGQSSIGAIFGTVKDTSGGVMAEAAVTVLNIETGASRSATTGDDGSYRFSALAVGHYDVKVEHSGFKPTIQKGVVLNVGDETALNFSLEVGTAAQEVVVEGEAPQVNTTSGTLGGLVSEEKIAELPLNGRNYLDLTLLQPGVTKSVTTVQLGGGTLGTIYSSNGAPTISNNYSIDGAMMQTVFGYNGASAVGTSLGVDGIREYRVVTSAFGAEYGMTMGSQMTIVSKSGANQFHGDVFEYLRNASLDAANVFDTTSKINGRRLAQYQRNNFGGAFGGPIRKDKTFFWAVYEGLRQVKGLPTTSTTLPASCHPSNAPLLKPGAGEAFTQTPGTGPAIGSGPGGSTPIDPACAVGAGVNPNILGLLELIPIPNPGGNTFSYIYNSPLGDNYGQIRVDHNFSSSDSLFGRYTIDDSSTTIPGAGVAGTWGGPEFSETSLSRAQYLTLSENHIFSPSFLNHASISYSRTLIPTNMNFLTSVSTRSVFDPTVSFNCPSGATPCAQPVGQITIQGAKGLPVFGPDNVIPNYHLQNIFTLSDDAFYTRGKHALRVGVLANRYNVRARESVARRGQLTFGSLSNFMQGTNATENAESPGSLKDRTFNWYTVGVYAQDDWRVTSRLTLNLGLRYEFNTTPREHAGLESSVVNLYTDPNAVPTIGPIINNPSKKNFSPRVGFAWDVAGNGKTAVHGAFGLYYDIAAGLGQSVFSQTNGDPPFNAQQTLGTPGTPTSGLHYIPNFINSANTDTAGTVRFATIPPSAYSDPSAFVKLFAPGTLGMAGPLYDSQQPYLMQWNLTIDRQLPWNSALSVGYVGTRGLHLWENTDNNPCIPTNASALGDPNVIPNWAGPKSCPNGRFNPNFNSMNQQSTWSQSWYHGLQVALTRKLKSGLEFQSAYTYSRALDTTEGLIIVGGSFAAVPGAYNLRLIEKGPSQFDATHNWRFNTIYHVRDLKSDNFGAKLLKGWWLSNIVSFQTGYPFSVFVGSNVSQSGVQGGRSPNNADRANLVTSSNLAAAKASDPLAVVYDPSTVIIGSPDHWFNQHMFTTPSPGFLGNEGRDLLRGPRLFDWDFSLNKDTRLPFLGEAGMVEFKADFFNIFNHANFSNPTYGGTGTGSIASASPGKILSTSTDPRDIQLALKFIF
jgi:outer membrane receptor protein involved in Fe transport